LTNLDSFVIFRTNIILILQCTLEKLAQHCNVVIWRWRCIWYHQKCRLQAKDGLCEKLRNCVC